MFNYPMNYSPATNYQSQYSAYQAQSQPINSLIRVTGIDGAKAYAMPPNSVAPLFDDQNDILYVKSTDGAGFPTIRVFKFSPIETPQPETRDYISRSEFEEFKASIKTYLKEGANNAE